MIQNLLNISLFLCSCLWFYITTLSPFLCCTPRLCPWLYPLQLYTTPFSTLISSRSLNQHLYADGIYIFISFAPKTTRWQQDNKVRQSHFHPFDRTNCRRDKQRLVLKIRWIYRGAEETDNIYHERATRDDIPLPETIESGNAFTFRNTFPKSSVFT